MTANLDSMLPDLKESNNGRSFRRRRRPDPQPLIPLSGKTSFAQSWSRADRSIVAGKMTQAAPAPAPAPAPPFATAAPAPASAAAATADTCCCNDDYRS